MADKNSPDRFKAEYKSRNDLFSALYSFLFRNDLTNPEVSFIMKNRKTGEDAKISFSRNGDYEGGYLPDEAGWKKQVSSPHLLQIMVVASTDKADTQRVSVIYYNYKGYERCLMVTFHSAVNRELTAAEERILHSLIR